MQHGAGAIRVMVHTVRECQCHQCGDRGAASLGFGAEPGGLRLEETGGGRTGEGRTVEGIFFNNTNKKYSSNLKQGNQPAEM